MLGSGAVSAASSAAAAATVPYKKGSFFLVPKKHTVDRKIAVRGAAERSKAELSHRSYKAQKHFFEVPSAPTYARDHLAAHNAFYNLETKIIWKAFDAPEMLGILLHDETILGHKGLYDEHILEASEHWTLESRYWRCIGISKPFFNKHTLRAHCWEDNGAQTGTLRLSAAMRHALMDLERAVRRKELGLDPNYLWDRWGPSGFIDGARSDFLPRFAQNPYVDPDGVDITELDVAPFNTHEQIRERYWEFIAPNVEAVEGCFLSIGHGPLTLSDIGNSEVQSLYTTLNPTAVAVQKQRDGDIAVPADDLRLLMYLAADPQLLQQLGSVEAWSDVKDALRDVASENNVKIDAARMLENTRHEGERVKRFYEEKCGFLDFANTSDKDLTGAALSYLRSLKSITTSAPYASWGKPLAECLSDFEKFRVMGPTAYRTYRLTEDLVLDKRRRQWATRFAGDANEEASLDYLLENFGRRPEKERNPGSLGGEFDREQEPIGRNVQRRVLDADKQSSLADARKNKGRVFNRRKNVFSLLHEKQMQNTSYGVR